MAAGRFHVAKPDQLQSLVKYARTNATTVSRMARIWKIAKEKKGDTRWDSGVYACFSGDRVREAAVYRVTAEHELIEVAALRYNLALNWCEQHLRQVYD